MPSSKNKNFLLKSVFLRLAGSGEPERVFRCSSPSKLILFVRISCSKKRENFPNDIFSLPDHLHATRGLYIKKTQKFCIFQTHCSSVASNEDRNEDFKYELLFQGPQLSRCIYCCMVGHSSVGNNRCLLLLYSFRSLWFERMGMENKTHSYASYHLLCFYLHSHLRC